MRRYTTKSKVRFSQDTPVRVTGFVGGRISTDGRIFGELESFLSWPAYVKAWETKCSPTDKLVLLAIADRINIDTNVCYPSAEDITERTGLTRSTVWKTIKKLEQSGVLCVVREHRKSNVYYLAGLGIPQIPPSIQKRRKVVSKKQLPSIPEGHQSERTLKESEVNQAAPSEKGWLAAWEQMKKEL